MRLISRFRLLLSTLAATLLVVTIPVTAHATTTLTLDGVRVALPAGTLQVITVRHTSGTYARATMWNRSSPGHWLIAARTVQARTGSGGLVAGYLRKQGTDTTPTGTYSIPFGFGVDAVADETYPYHRVTSADWWVEDNASPYYNRLRGSTTGFRWWLSPSLVNSSEHLIAYRPQYDLALVIGFNYDKPVHYRGAGIFLHVNGRGATGGCVSAPRSFVYYAIGHLHASSHPVIAIG